jgi:hypothetical protein
MPTLSKIRFDASTKEHYEKLAERTGSMKAVVAECRKLICLMYSLWTKEEMYAPDYKHGSVDPKPVLPPVDTVAPAVPADLEERKNESADVTEPVTENTEPVTENTVPCTENAEKTASETFLRSVPQSVKTKAPMLPKPLRKTSHCARKTPEKASGDISKPTGKKRKKNVR